MRRVPCLTLEGVLNALRASLALPVQGRARGALPSTGRARLTLEGGSASGPLMRSEHLLLSPFRGEQEMLYPERVSKDSVTVLLICSLTTVTRLYGCPNAR